MKKIILILTTLTSLMVASATYKVDYKGEEITPKHIVKMCKPLKNKVDNIIGTKDVSELNIYDKARVMHLEYKILTYCKQCKKAYVPLDQLETL